MNNPERDAVSLPAFPEMPGTDAVVGTNISFKKLGNRFNTGLLLAFLLPMATLSVYFHFQFTFTLKESAKLNLAAISESQRNTENLPMVMPNFPPSNRSLKKWDSK